MRRETAGVTESLLQAAKEEFLTYGFHDASMRRISAACGVSTNSIYTRFGDKSGLFTAIVQEAADGLMEMYMQSIQKATECPDMDHAIEEGNEGTDQVLAYIYEVLTHDKPYDEAAAFMKNVQIFNFAGWKAVFGL